MNFQHLPVRPERVAVIGSGISGLASAYLLAPNKSVTLFESAPRLGGHARTIIAGRNNDQPVDTGFIVFNYANYPHLTRMFLDLDVPVAKSNMSFGATINDGGIEYGFNDLGALIAQPRNLMRPGFYRMMSDIFKFNANAEALAENEAVTIGELMDEMRLGDWFQKYYLTPLCGAIWSTPTEEIRNFPARALVQFFRNHALLSTTGQHQWWTVKGGSTEYVSRVERNLISQGVCIQKNTPVLSVRRDGVQSIVETGSQRHDAFDHVIFACHADQALALLERPTADESHALSSIRFQDNHMVLHCDRGQMPKREKVWSSWVYKADTRTPEPAIGVTYWMNRLQNIPYDDPLFVSLNPSDPVREETIYDEKTFRHPVFDAPALAAQKRLRDIQGQNGTWFAGAYTRHGFHEDGFASAVRIARLMDKELV